MRLARLSVKKMRALCAGLAVVAGVTLTGAPASAQGGVPGHLDKIQRALDRLQRGLDEIEDKLDVLHVEAVGIKAFAAPGASRLFDPLNRTNALILVRVTFKGEGVAGLTAANVTIATRLVPPGECALEIDEFSFFGPPAGDYALAVTPIDTAGCDWEAGSYVSSIEVTSSGMKGSTLVEIVVD